MAKTSRDSVQQMLRLTDDLRDQLRAFADENGRSLNAEIVERLEQSIASAGNAERLERLILEKNQLIALHDATKRVSYHAQALLFVFGDLIRQFAEGNERPLRRFADQSKTHPEMLNFEMPDAITGDDDPS